MIKKNTRKVIFGKKKESDHFCLCNPGIMGFGILFSAPEGNQESVTVTINKNPGIQVPLTGNLKSNLPGIRNPPHQERGIQNPRVSFITVRGTGGGSRGGPRGARLSLFFGPNGDPKRRNKIFETRSPFYPGVDDPTPSPLI